MKFSCDKCEAKYQIADEKVAGKTVRMKCRKCGILIQVRAERTAAGVRAVPLEAAAAKPAPAPKPAAKAKPAPATAAAEGDWFVNFSSYSQRSVAENWAKKLKPSAGKAIVASSTRDGKTFYRVRIIGLNDRAAARKVAGELESAYNLPPLWVGSD